MNISIIGGSGYAGGELLRLLLQHSEVDVLQVTSQRFAGMPISLPHPNLRGLTSLRFTKAEEIKPCDLLFVALPNGKSMETMSKWMTSSKMIIDLGADFRLRNPETWRTWYGTDHTSSDLLIRFVYGVPELFREQIKTAHYVAGPGCEAIVSILSLYAFIKHGLIKKDRIIIDAKMGSSGTGNKVSPATHHPERAGVVRSYKPIGHRHAAEIEQALSHFYPGVFVNISATAVEMVRGILVTIHTELEDENITEKEIWKIIRVEYKDEPFIRIIKQKQGLYRFPEPKILQGTNICEIGFEKELRGNRLVIMGAIDNLVKGTAGNAVQCMNLMCGFPEGTGLGFSGLHPV